VSGWLWQARRFGIGLGQFHEIAFRAPAFKCVTEGVLIEMSDHRNVAQTAPTSANKEIAKGEQHPGDLEKCLAVLSKLKDLEFHSRANIETLAQLSLTVEEELKQREFSEAIGAIYSAQDAFHSKIAAFIETYKAKCESLGQPA